MCKRKKSIWDNMKKGESDIWEKSIMGFGPHWSQERGWKGGWIDYMSLYSLKNLSLIFIIYVLVDYNLWVVIIDTLIL